MEVRAQRARGMALLLAVAVVGIAAVFGVALLSMSSLQSQAGATTARAVSADAMAESGVNLALFYLQNPARAPVLNSSGHWPGGSNISFGASVPGSVDVTVTELSNGHYEVVSIGRLDSASSEGLRRTMRVRAKVNTGFHAPYAAAFTGDITIRRGVRVVGDLQTPGLLTVGLLGEVHGTALVPVPPIVLGDLLSVLIIDAAEADKVPRAQDLHDYRTYTYNRAVYQAEQVPSVLENQTLGPTPSNPAGVYWSDGNLDLVGNVRIDGTLLVRNGRLRVRSGTAVITPVRDFPALVADGDVRLQMDAGGETLIVNGLVWMGGRIDRSGAATNGRIEVNGAFIMSGGGTIDLGSQGTVRLEHVSDKTTVPNLTKNVGQVPLSVTITSWNSQ